MSLTPNQRILAYKERINFAHQPLKAEKDFWREKQNSHIEEAETTKIVASFIPQEALGEQSMECI